MAQKELSEADIEDFGVEKFRLMKKRYGKKYAITQVTRHRTTIRNQNCTEENSMDDMDQYGIDDTEVWLTQDSIECVLGAI